MTNRNILLNLIGALRLVIEKNNITASPYYSHYSHGYVNLVNVKKNYFKLIGFTLVKI